LIILNGLLVFVDALVEFLLTLRCSNPLKTPPQLLVNLLLSPLVVFFLLDFLARRLAQSAAPQYERKKDLYQDSNRDHDGYYNGVVIKLDGFSLCWAYRSLMIPGCFSSSRIPGRCGRVPSCAE